MQLYEDGALHRLVGVEPRIGRTPEVVINGDDHGHDRHPRDGRQKELDRDDRRSRPTKRKHSPSRDKREIRPLDMDLSDGEVQDAKEKSDDEEEGRYGIQSYQSRQRLAQDVVFMTDDDDVDSISSDSDAEDFSKSGRASPKPVPPSGEKGKVNAVVTVNGEDRQLASTSGQVGIFLICPVS